MMLRSRAGKVNRVAVVLLALICVMLVLIAIPGCNAYRYRAARLACSQAMSTARDGLIIEYLKSWDTGSAQEAMYTLDEVMPGREDLCPSGGTIYLVRRSDGIFEPVCGLHDTDEKQRVRLNATHGLDLLRAALAEKRGQESGATTKITLNGKSLKCVRVTREEKDLRRGTRSTNGYEGVVAYYGLAGDGDFQTGGLKAGEVCYFVYADENHCAIWRVNSGWQGDAYQ